MTTGGISMIPTLALWRHNQQPPDSHKSMASRTILREIMIGGAGVSGGTVERDVLVATAGVEGVSGKVSSS